MKAARPAKATTGTAKIAARKRTLQPPSAGTSLGSLEERLGYHFQSPALLELAVTHSSFVYEARLGRSRVNGDEPNEPGTDNEQLEFLGDAVLGMVVTELLLNEFPGRTEGELTRMRSAIVSRKRMAQLGEVLEVNTALRLGKSAEAVDGRQKMAVLANTAEAVLGAIYLDARRATDARPRAGEQALRAVRALVDRLLVQPDLPAIRQELAATPGRGALRDAKSRLQERVQAVNAGRLIYVDTAAEGPAHARQFSVEVCLQGEDGRTQRLAAGEGASKKEAQQAAATVALKIWEAREPEPSA